MRKHRKIDPRNGFSFSAPLAEHGEAAPAVVPLGMVLIYGLCDPRDGTLRYVGQTSRPGNRLDSYSSATTGNEFTWRWCRALKRRRIQPDMVVIDLVVEAEWKDAEAKWVMFYRERGHLYNAIPGGITDNASAAIFPDHHRNLSQLRAFLRAIPKKKRRRDPWAALRGSRAEHAAQVSRRQMG